MESSSVLHCLHSEHLEASFGPFDGDLTRAKRAYGPLPLFLPPPRLGCIARVPLNSAALVPFRVPLGPYTAKTAISFVEDAGSPAGPSIVIVGVQVSSELSLPLLMPSPAGREKRHGERI